MAVADQMNHSNAVVQQASTMRTHPGRVLAFDRLLATVLQRKLEGACVRIELWDGSTPFATPPAIGALIVGDRRTLVGLTVNPDLYFGEAYMAGRLRVVGDLGQVLEALSRLWPSTPMWRERVALWFARSNTLGSSRCNVHHHYDLGNDFYKLWLDEQLVYTCAYFRHPDVSLEDAQREKLDLVCRKLALRPGETVVEAGCGWGALALHMARHYGVRVKAFNISREQILYARDRAAREGLTDRVEFIDEDYRSISGRFDVFVSVGMLEHVGRGNFQRLAEVLRRSIRPDGGRGLLHFIGRDVPRPLNAWIRRRIFPGAYPPTVPEVTRRILEPAGMAVIDVENLRLHYARTLSHWTRRFLAATDQVCAKYGEEFRRAWELYLRGSEAAFSTGTLQLFQVAFVPSRSQPPYWTRQSIYVNESEPE